MLLVSCMCSGPSHMEAPLVSDIEAFSVRLTWLPPTQPNGVIINYHIYQNDLVSHNVRQCLLSSARVIDVDVNFLVISPRVGPGHPSSPLSFYFLIFSPLFTFLFLSLALPIFFLSIPSLSTRIVPLRFQAGGRRTRRRPNLGLVCVSFCSFVIRVICIP